MSARIRAYLKNPYKLFNLMANKNLLFFLPDEVFLKLVYRGRMGKKLNIKNPITYNEKIQWLKLNDRNPLYTKLVDKYEVKQYVSEKISSNIIIPTLGVWNSVDEIDFDSLPNQFVLKCTHDSGGLVICKDKSKLNIPETKKILNRCLKKNYYGQNREWPYKNVIPRIIAEKFIVDESGTELKDYKFFCFNGKPLFMFIATDRPHDTRFDFYDMEFNHLPFTNGHENSEKNLTKPKSFNEMIQLAQEISKDFVHVRVDFYDVNGTVYFGEITFYHWSGMKPFVPEEWDYKFGEFIDLNIVKEHN